MNSYTNDELLERIRVPTIRNGGGTFDLETLECLTEGGYVVGDVHDDYAQWDVSDGDWPTGRAIRAVLNDMVSEHPLIRTFGTWLDDGMLVLDPVIVISSRARALGYAWGLEQRAIYHLDTGETLTLGERLGEYTSDRYCSQECAVEAGEEI